MHESGQKMEANAADASPTQSGSKSPAEGEATSGSTGVAQTITGTGGGNNPKGGDDDEEEL